MRCNTLRATGESKGAGCLCDKWCVRWHCRSAHELASRTPRDSRREHEKVWIYLYICSLATRLYGQPSSADVHDSEKGVRV